MKITVDTEKDSKDDIKAAISVLQKILGEGSQENVSAEGADDLLKLISEPKSKRTKKGGDDEGNEDEDLPSDIPKSVKEAYELTEDLETY